MRIFWDGDYGESSTKKEIINNIGCLFFSIRYLEFSEIDWLALLSQTEERYDDHTTFTTRDGQDSFFEPICAKFLGKNQKIL